MAAIIAAHHEAEELARREAAERAMDGLPPLEVQPPAAPTAEQCRNAKRALTLKKLNAVVPNPKLPGQIAVLTLYYGNACQLFVAGLIFLNFIISAIEAQIMITDADKDEHGFVFSVFEWTFNILFGIELIINIYAHFWCPFWKNPWNVFDVVIVAISWISMVGDLPGITVLRLFRAFRAFRLFKRIESVRIIVVAVGASLPGVSNAFLLLIIIMGIWAIMGVSFFRHDFEDLFGNFGKAMLTLFQVMTFDSWVSGVTRPVCLYYNSYAAPVYFISYMFVSGIIMTNVVVAILLDKFMEASSKLEMEKANSKVEERALPKVDPKVGLSNEDLAAYEAAELSKTSRHTWKHLSNHLCFDLSKMERTIKRPFPETAEAEYEAEQFELIKREQERLARRSADKLPCQSFLKECYESSGPQMTVALAICGNFLVSAAKAEILPRPDGPSLYLDDASRDQAKLAFTIFEWFFNLLFGFELVVNMYSNFFMPFWQDPWNIFDFFIVAISWLSMLGMLQGGISVLRLFRAFRVFRLFKRVKSLRQIIAGIGKSLPGVSNAFIILGLVMGIWSIMGKNFFGEEFPDLFGNFFLAMLSMFQVMSYDSWSSGITRPVVFRYSPNPTAPIFFITYVFISAIIMSNVVLAILLDKFLAAAKEFEDAEKAAAGDEDGSTQGILPFDDIMGMIDSGIFVESEHLKEFEESMQAKLSELHHIVQGPLTEFVASTREMPNGVYPKKSGCCPFDFGGKPSSKTRKVVPQ